MPAVRLDPCSPPYPPQIEELLGRWMAPGFDVEPLALFRTLALHDTLASRMQPLGAGILGPSARVPAELREVMIHRTCALCAAEYEWGVHAIGFGRPLGLSDEQLRSTVHGSWRDECWSKEQACVMRLAEELHDSSAVSDELWSTLRDSFDPAQIIELLITAGWYHTISYLCNGLGIELEQWAERFPAA